MARKRDVASEVVAFFESASIETAQTVLAICKGIVARRQPAAKKARAARPAASEADKGSTGGQ